MPYSEVTISGYNANPPTDDGSAVSDNEISWSKHKTKIGDPLKTAIETTQTNITTIVNTIEGDIDVIEAYFTSGILEDAHGGANTLQGYFTAGVLDIAHGGTGQATAAEAVGELTQALTEDTAPDFTADFVSAYDASADTGTKIGLDTLLRPSSTAAPIGYAAGAGGTVTQLTSKSTGVTINKLAGQITTHNAALASGDTVEFVVTNSLVAAADIILICGANGFGGHTLKVVDVDAGSFTIHIRNDYVLSHSDAILINFIVLKGATS